MCSVLRWLVLLLVLVVGVALPAAALIRSYTGLYIVPVMYTARDVHEAAAISVRVTYNSTATATAACFNTHCRLRSW
jgi:hypothetical protein